jgi:hypothetical protein
MMEDDGSDLDMFLDEEEQLKREQEERERRMKEIQLKHLASKSSLQAPPPAIDDDLTPSISNNIPSSA